MNRLLLTARNSDFPRLDVPLLRMLYERPKPRPQDDPDPDSVERAK